MLVGIAVVVGLLMTGWSVYMIVRYALAPREERRSLRFYFYLGLLFFLIGTGDLFKVYRDVRALLEQ